MSSKRKSKRKKRAIGLAGILIADHAYSKVCETWIVQDYLFQIEWMLPLQITMSTKAKKAAAAVVQKPKCGTAKRKSWRRLMWDAVSIYDVEAVRNCTR